MTMIRTKEEQHFKVITLYPPFDLHELQAFVHEAMKHCINTPVKFDEGDGSLRVEFEGSVITTPWPPE